jgi:hypothetical protein
MSTVADVLDRAADVIAERGHYKGDYEGPGGEVCVAGAIRVAVTGTAMPHPKTADRTRHVIGSAYNSLGRAIGDPIITYWNDAPGRPADEVIAALREAARRERGAA